MHSYIPNFIHLILQQPNHPLHYFIPLLMIHIKQLQRMLVTAKQLLLLLLPIPRSHPRVRILIIPIDQLIPLIPDPIIRKRLLNSIAVHPVPVIRNLLPVP
jgi:hypothetical protein